MSTYNGRSLLFGAPLAAAAMIALAEQETFAEEVVRKDEIRLVRVSQEQEQERKRRADVGSAPAANAVHRPHQGKRERERRLRAMERMKP